MLLSEELFQDEFGIDLQTSQVILDEIQKNSTLFCKQNLYIKGSRHDIANSQTYELLNEIRFQAENQIFNLVLPPRNTFCLVERSLGCGQCLANLEIGDYGNVMSAYQK